MKIIVQKPVLLNAHQVARQGNIPRYRIIAAAKTGQLAIDALDALGHPLFALARLDEIVNLLTPPVTAS